MSLFKGFNLRHIDEGTMEGPIVEHGILEDDIYKFLMGQFVMNRPELRGAVVQWRFKNRTTAVHLATHIDEKDFADQFDYFKHNARLDNRGHHYLRGTFEYDQGKDQQMFSNEYLHYLCNELDIPAVNFSKTNDGQLDITWKGTWIDASMVEIPMLKIINGLYYRSLLGDMSTSERYAVYAQGIVRLSEKVQLLREHENVMFSDFGNRRRFGGVWQRHIDEVLADELPNQFWGTSNTYLAMELGVRPVGTCAHEIAMIITAMKLAQGEELGTIQNRIQEEWNNDWGYPLAISLPDTYGTDYCLKAYSDETVRALKGFRADSKDPIECIELYIKRFKEAGVDPTTRMGIPSDGLTVPQMINISDTFQGRIHISHGLGTHLTNDMGLQTLSIVCKADSVNGLPCVKLSDNVQKATGASSAVQQYKLLAGYVDQYSEVPVV